MSTGCDEIIIQLSEKQRFDGCNLTTVWEYKRISILSFCCRVYDVCWTDGSQADSEIRAGA